MATVIRGTDNSVSAPAISGNDGDTGIFFPAANQVAIATAGTQRFLVDGNGNAGLGTNPNSGWGNNWSTLQISSQASISGNSSDKVTYIANNFYNDNTFSRYIATGEAASYQQYQGQHQFFTAGSGSAGSVILWTNKFNIDVSGRVTMPFQPFAHISLGSTQTVTGANTTLQFNAAVVNQGNHFNTSTYRFTAPIAGDYLVMIGIRRNSAQTSNYTRFSVQKNGSLTAASLQICDPIWNLPNTGYSTATQDCILRLAAGDYIEVIDYSNAFNVVYAANECHFIIRLIG